MAQSLIATPVEPAPLGVAGFFPKDDSAAVNSRRVIGACFQGRSTFVKSQPSPDMGTAPWHIFFTP